VPGDGGEGSVVAVERALALLSAVSANGTAALIGGVSVYGGRGRVAGILLGVLTLQFLLGALALLSAPFWAAYLATGVLLLAFLVLELAQEQSPARLALERARIRWSAQAAGSAPGALPAAEEARAPDS
jgi:ribose/xylose/arabinose/galactoside ABC-type transport system permease subunit